MQTSEFFQSFINSLNGFLSFELFISPIVLLFVYYAGAVIFPIIIYRYITQYYKNIAGFNIPEVEIYVEKLASKLSTGWVFILAFILFEICWRIFFEFFMAYFQMREALMNMNVTG